MYFFVYSIVALIAIALGARVYQTTRNISWLFFLSFTSFLSTWFILYFLFFVEYITSPSILLYLSRINFIIWIIAVYSLLWFVFYFNAIKVNTRLLKFWFVPLFAILACVYIFTPIIIDTLRFSVVDGVYREVYGSWYMITIVLHILFLILFIVVSIQKLRKVSNLDRIRLKRILYSAYFMLFMMILLQVWLPLFDIWILEKELIFFYIFFVVQVYVTLKRYYFGSLWYGIGRFLVFMSALLLAIVWHFFITYFLIQHNSYLWQFWDFSDPYNIIGLSLSVLIFFGSLNLFSHYFLGNHHKESLRESIFLLQNTIIPIMNLDEMNQTIFYTFHKIFFLKNARVYIFSNSWDEWLKGVKTYFEYGLIDSIYIHDIVFREENKNHIDASQIESNIPNWVFMILPLFRDTICIGILTLGPKSFGDFYTKNEIQVLRNFSYFLAGHIQYISTYSLLQDLSINLDRRVDEKTIEYNNLINRQKEFISVISHEIKSPISTAIFQSDSMIDDIDSPDYDREKMKWELQVLSAQLIRTGGLLSKLFAVEYYDTHGVNLFRENVEFVSFLSHEIELFSHVYPDTTFRSELDRDIGFVQIDKIQFQQVINNLLDNAVKFTKHEDPLICISARKDNNILYVVIEDNGWWFEWVDIENLFDKYTIGSNWSTGLWMGLYLCKKIISMHNGTIEASVSPLHHGARFTITIPIQ
jgi:K+-sensing histidine kinase KdpD